MVQMEEPKNGENNLLLDETALLEAKYGLSLGEIYPLATAYYRGDL